LDKLLKDFSSRGVVTDTTYTNKSVTNPLGQQALQLHVTSED
jgi:hypothetical protein